MRTLHDERNLSQKLNKFDHIDVRETASLLTNRVLEQLRFIESDGALKSGKSDLVDELKRIKNKLQKDIEKSWSPQNSKGSSPEKNLLALIDTLESYTNPQDITKEQKDYIATLPIEKQEEHIKITKQANNLMKQFIFEAFHSVFCILDPKKNKYKVSRYENDDVTTQLIHNSKPIFEDIDKLKNKILTQKLIQQLMLLKYDLEEIQIGEPQESIKTRLEAITKADEIADLMLELIQKFHDTRSLGTAYKMLKLAIEINDVLQSMGLTLSNNNDKKLQEEFSKAEKSVKEETLDTLLPLTQQLAEKSVKEETLDTLSSPTQQLAEKNKIDTKPNNSLDSIASYINTLADKIIQDSNPENPNYKKQLIIIIKYLVKEKQNPDSLYHPTLVQPLIDKAQRAIFNSNIVKQLDAYSKARQGWFDYIWYDSFSRNRNGHNKETLTSRITNSSNAKQEILKCETTPEGYKKFMGSIQKKIDNQIENSYFRSGTSARNSRLRELFVNIQDETVRMLAKTSCDKKTFTECASIADKNYMQKLRDGLDRYKENRLSLFGRSDGVFLKAKDFFFSKTRDDERFKYTGFLTKIIEKIEAATSEEDRAEYLTQYIEACSFIINKIDNLHRNPDNTWDKFIIDLNKTLGTNQSELKETLIQQIKDTLFRIRNNHFPSLSDDQISRIYSTLTNDHNTHAISIASWAKNAFPLPRPKSRKPSGEILKKVERRLEQHESSSADQRLKNKCKQVRDQVFLFFRSDMLVQAVNGRKQLLTAPSSGTNNLLQLQKLANNFLMIPEPHIQAFAGLLNTAVKGATVLHAAVEQNSPSRKIDARQCKISVIEALAMAVSEKFVERYEEQIGKIHSEAVDEFANFAADRIKYAFEQGEISVEGKKLDTVKEMNKFAEEIVNQIAYQTNNHSTCLPIEASIRAEDEQPYQSYFGVGKLTAAGLFQRAGCKVQSKIQLDTNKENLLIDSETYGYMHFKNIAEFNKFQKEEESLTSQRNFSKSQKIPEFSNSTRFGPVPSDSQDPQKDEEIENLTKQVKGQEQKIQDLEKKINKMEIVQQQQINGLLQQIQSFFPFIEAHNKKPQTQNAMNTPSLQNPQSFFGPANPTINIRASDYQNAATNLELPPTIEVK